MTFKQFVKYFQHEKSGCLLCLLLVLRHSEIMYISTEIYRQKLLSNRKYNKRKVIYMSTNIQLFIFKNI